MPEGKEETEGPMDWTTRLNKIMDYVEASVHERDFQKKKSARLRHVRIPCSAFSQIVGIPFSEYVRRRRLTMAAYELLNTDRKLLLTSQWIMATSPDDAFRVAFKNL